MTPPTATATLRLTQTVPATPGQAVKLPMTMPLRVALFGRETGPRGWATSASSSWRTVPPR